MKLPAQILALCAVGCGARAAEPVYPVHPTEPVGNYEISDPRLPAEDEAVVIEALPAEVPIVAAPVEPVPLFRLRPLLPPAPPPRERRCISCGMG